LIAATAAILGAVLVLRFKVWAQKNSLSLINFAAGAMIATAFIHLLPEAAHQNSKALIWVLIGFCAMYFAQFVILFHPHHEHTFEDIGHFSIIALSFHSLLDGLIVALGFEADINIGIFTALAILLHKLPDGITISGILAHGGASAKKILGFSVFTALWTPIGTLAGLLLFKDVSAQTLGAALSIAGGSFIFLAASDLIPETHKSKNRMVPLFFFLGVFLILFTRLAFNID
jgi:ZIP family zinc transporter/zinc and cadmium transporter